MECTEWISHEYSCPLGSTTKEKMAPQRRLHPSQKKQTRGGGGHEEGNRKGKEVKEKYGDRRKGEGGGQQGSIKNTPPSEV